MNPNANIYIPKPSFTPPNMNDPFQKIMILNQTIQMLLIELGKKDNHIRSNIIEYNMLKTSTMNESKIKDNKINTLNNKIEALENINKSLINNLNIKNKTNETLRKTLATVNSNLKESKTKEIYNETNIRLLEHITKIEDTNKDFKKKIEELEKTIQEKEKHLNECIDTIFMYQMKYDKI